MTYLQEFNTFLNIVGAVGILILVVIVQIHQARIDARHKLLNKRLDALLLLYEEDAKTKDKI